MANRRMGDAVNVNNLPAGLDLYAAYINGRYTRNNYTLMHLRFPTSLIVTITVDGSLTFATVADYENGDYTPQSAAAWAAWMVQHHFRPTIYCNRGNYLSVENFLSLYKLQFGRDVDCWLSTLDGTQTSNLPGVVAIQFDNHNGLWDESVVFAATWPEQEPAPPTQLKELEMVIIQSSDPNGPPNNQYNATYNGTTAVRIHQATSLQGWAKVLPVVVLDWADYSGIAGAVN